MSAARGPFIIREIEDGDAPSILSLARTLAKWFNPQGLAQMAYDLGFHRGYVAVRGDRLLGFVTWTQGEAATAAELSWMGVAEEMQHQGIGTTLLSALVAELRRRRFRYLTVSTVADSVDYEPYAETRRFYRARGFKDDRVDVGYFGEGDDRYDRLLLRLDLTK